MSTLLTRDAGNPAAPGRGERSGLRAHAPAGAREGSSTERARRDVSDAHAGGRLTLEQRLDSVWEGLHAGGAPDCPVCRAELDPLGGAHASRCGGCGSILC